MSGRLLLPDAVQGARHVVVSLTWPGGLALTGATITGTKRTHRGVVTALDGTLTPDADQEANPGLFTWDYGAGDVGEWGDFLVQFRATFTDFDAVIESAWTVHRLQSATAVAAENVVGVPQSGADFLAAVEAAAAAATLGQVGTADGAGGVTFEDAAAGTTWGGITGTLSDQTDLDAALDAKQPLDAGLTDLAGLAVTDGNIAVGDGANWVAESGATARASLGAADTAAHLVIAASDEDSDLAIATPAITFRMPHAMTLTEVRANVGDDDAPTGSAIQADINEGGVSILSTKITIDAGTTTSEAAATPPVISDTALADNAIMSIDIDGVGSTNPGKGLKITLIGTRP